MLPATTLQHLPGCNEGVENSESEVAHTLSEPGVHGCNDERVDGVVGETAPVGGYSQRVGKLFVRSDVQGENDEQSERRPAREETCQAS